MENFCLKRNNSQQPNKMEKNGTIHPQLRFEKNFIIKEFSRFSTIHTLYITNYYYR